MPTPSKACSPQCPDHCAKDSSQRRLAVRLVEATILEQARSYLGNDHREADDLDNAVRYQEQARALANDIPQSHTARTAAP